MQNGGRIRPESVRLKDAAPASNVVPIFRDGLINALTGMGGTMDPRSYQHYFHRRLSDHEIMSAYRGGWLMRRIIDKPATEMVREWRDWQADQDDIEKIEAEEKRLDLRNKVKLAASYGDLGGGAVIMFVPGAQDHPLSTAAMRAGDLKAIHVWHKSRLRLGPMIEAWDDPYFGQPSYYEVQLTGSSGAMPLRFHPSRVVAFKGLPVPDAAITSWEESFWGDSRVSVVLDAVANVDASQNGFAALIKDARNRRLSVPGLLDMVATAEGESRFSKRVQALAAGESSYGITWLDGGNGEGKGAETLTDRQMTWAGIPDIAAMYLSAAAAAADMPATVLLGKSPDGMNATGSSDLAIWEKTIRGRQDLDLRPCMTQIDAALIPSALGKIDDTIWYEWAPLSTQSEKDEAATFFAFSQAIEKIQATGAIPDIAFEKGLQNAIIERGWLPGMEDALGELPEDERFPSLAAPDDTEVDPSALQSGNGAEGGDPTSSGAGATGINASPRRRAVNDARFMDATPRTLYVSRKLLNADEVIRWAKSQGIETTLPADDMHVTVAFSRNPVDWMTVGTDWSGDEKGNLLVRPGGPRTIERMGDGTAVALQFLDDSLAWRHQRIRDAGASWDWPSYQPHVTLSWVVPADFDLSKVEPYQGPLKFGPELFAEVDEDWKAGVTEK